MAIIKEGIKFIHAVFIKASNVFKILDTDESVNYIFIRLLSRLVVSKYYEDSWSYFIDDIYGKFCIIIIKNNITQFMNK